MAELVPHNVLCITSSFSHHFHTGVAICLDPATKLPKNHSLVVNVESSPEDHDSKPWALGLFRAYKSSTIRVVLVII